MASSKNKDQFSDKEAQRRFEAALRGGLSTQPKHRRTKQLKRKKKPGK
jgi:hypothetical protein